MASGGADPEGETVIPGNWDSGGDVEVSGGDFKSPAHSLHRLPLIPTWILGELRHRYRHP